MLMPALIPDALKKYQVCTSDDLLETLQKYRDDIIQFFEFAVDDETWSFEHPDFIREFLVWLTQCYLQNQMTHEEALIVQKKIHQHQKILLPLLIDDWEVCCPERSFKVNSLLFGTASDGFAQILHAGQEKGEASNLFKDIDQKSLHQIVEFIQTGNIAHIWRNTKEEIYQLHDHARFWVLEAIVKMCQDTMKRYIDRDNVYEMIRQTHRDHWLYLRAHCFQYINDLHYGVVLHNGSVDTFRFEFLNWRDAAWEVFEQVRELITELVIGGELAEEEDFTQAVQSCPSLAGMDLSGSIAFSSRYREIPAHLQHLNLSSCFWLSDEYLGQFIGICPHLRSLVLDSNTQITYRGLGELNRLKELETLSLKSLIQIQDQEFRLLFRACPSLISLDLERCAGVTDISFMEYARAFPKLVTLNLARTRISDAALIALLSNCGQLRELDLTRADNITDKGLLEALRNARELQLLRLCNRRLSEETLEEIAQIRPSLKFVGRE